MPAEDKTALSIRERKRRDESEIERRNAPPGGKTPPATARESKRRCGPPYPVPPTPAPQPGGTGLRDTEHGKAPKEGAPPAFVPRSTDGPRSGTNEDAEGPSSQTSVETFPWPNEERKCSCILTLFSKFDPLMNGVVPLLPIIADPDSLLAIIQVHDPGVDPENFSMYRYVPSEAFRFLAHRGDRALETYSHRPFRELFGPDNLPLFRYVQDFWRGNNTWVELCKVYKLEGRVAWRPKITWKSIKFFADLWEAWLGGVVWEQELWGENEVVESFLRSLLLLRYGPVIELYSTRLWIDRPATKFPITLSQDQVTITIVDSNDDVIVKYITKPTERAKPYTFGYLARMCEDKGCRLSIFARERAVAVSKLIAYARAGYRGLRSWNFADDKVDKLIRLLARRIPRVRPLSAAIYTTS
jgi:hypothetical protein